MESFDNILRVFFDNVGVDEDRDPVVGRAFTGFDAIHAETTGETRHTTEHRLKGLGQVMRDVVLLKEMAES